jgi:hypothetical protein
MKENSGDGLEETVVMGELVPIECIEFEHFEIDRNGRVCVAENESQKPDIQELKDSLK